MVFVSVEYHMKMQIDVYQQTDRQIDKRISTVDREIDRYSQLGINIQQFQFSQKATQINPPLITNPIREST